MSSEKIKKLARIINEAVDGELLLDNKILTGFSGEKLISLMQRISSQYLSEDDCYLEVGVFQGLTLLSVASVMKANHAFGIDNFEHHDPQGKNYKIVKERIDALSIDNASIINMDYEDALESLSKYIGERKIGLYFVDGPHDYRSQFMCLELVKPYLADNAVIIIDDSNYRHVRQANRDFLTVNPEFKMVFEAYTDCHPYNMTNEQIESARSGWWDGVNVLVKDLGDEIEPMLPKTIRNRLIYENDHVIHAAKVAECAPYAVRSISSLMSFNIGRFMIDSFRVLKTIIKSNEQFNGKFRSMNTFSHDLPKNNINPSLLADGDT